MERLGGLIMIISGVAIGQWKSCCKKYNKSKETKVIKQKIERAVHLGQVTHIYRDSSYIVRYYDLNFLVSNQEEVMTIWRDTTTPIVKVSERLKVIYDKIVTITI